MKLLICIKRDKLKPLHDYYFSQLIIGYVLNPKFHDNGQKIVEYITILYHIIFEWKISQRIIEGDPSSNSCNSHCLTVPINVSGIHLVIRNIHSLIRLKTYSCVLSNSQQKALPGPIPNNFGHPVRRWVQDRVWMWVCGMGKEKEVSMDYTFFFL